MLMLMFMLILAYLIVNMCTIDSVSLFQWIRSVIKRGELQEDVTR